MQHMHIPAVHVTVTLVLVQGPRSSQQLSEHVHKQHDSAAPELLRQYACGRGGLWCAKGVGCMAVEDVAKDHGQLAWSIMVPGFTFSDLCCHVRSLMHIEAPAWALDTELDLRLHNYLPALKFERTSLPAKCIA